VLIAADELVRRRFDTYANLRRRGATITQGCLREQPTLLVVG